MRTHLITWLCLAGMFGAMLGVIFVDNKRLVFVERIALLQAPEIK